MMAYQMIQSGELGSVISLRGYTGNQRLSVFESDWRTKRQEAGGGILLDQGIHLVDMMRLFAGEFTQVYSFISNGFWKHDVEDNAYALMKTDNGVVAMLQSSATQWRHRFMLEINLERGMISLSGILSGSKSYGAETITIAYAGEKDEGDPREVTTRYNTDTSWQEEINDFAESIIHDRPITNGSSKDALATMKLVYNIYCADPSWQQKYRLDDRIPQDIL